jgi:SpoVK/Ycf46/Vps4 family AAA+-type ATPase
VSQLPPELLRKGRLDEIFYIDLPSPEERAQIFRIHLAKRGRKWEDFDLTSLVSGSHDFSGAEIEAAIVSALYDAFYAKEELSTRYVLAALSETVPLARTMAENIAAQRDWAKGRARNASVGQILTAQ